MPTYPYPITNDKVGFLVGLQSAISSINSNRTAIPGHFYLTQDAHRLYIGNNDGSLSAVNEGVITVDRVASLPSVTAANQSLVTGQFYYAQSENVLCVYSGQRWVQINPDTYLLRNTNAVTGTVDSTNTVTIKTEVKDTNDGVNVAEHYGVGVGDVVSGQFTIAGGNNVTVGWNSTTNTITLTTPDTGVYDISVAENSTTHKPELILTEYLDNNKTTPVGSTAIPIVGDNLGYITTAVSNGSLVISGSGLNVNGGSISAQTSNNGIRFIVEDSKTATINTPIITQGVTLKNVDGTTTNPTYFTHTVDNSSNPKTVTSVANLNVYTKDAVDALLAESMQDAEGMYFYGTLGANGTKSSFDALGSATDLRSGATLKIIQDGLSHTGVTIEGLTASDAIEAGDMIIVVGDEYQNTNSSNATTYLDPSASGYNPALIGTLVPSTRRYIYIPSGNDTDVYWTPNTHINNENEAISWSHSNGENVEKIVFAQAANSQITVSGANATSGGGAVHTKTLTIGHKNMYEGNIGDTTAPAVSTSTTSNESNGTQLATKSYTAITGLTLENGHVTGYATTQIDLKPNRLTQVKSEATTTVGSNIVKLTNTYYDGLDRITLTQNDWQLSSDTLAVTVSEAGSTNSPIKTADIHVDMVWGSFS
jgi:hypothetical protein